ncbi:unnamed protein product [Rotaria magnacalcarata]|uniref:VCBS repeat-containing protein n=1 Tax=Rotaria magnacalcarata TaxID=392030 RepID=A0A816M714_9BILA|nr:unnamed protein product [Rotaria magnacalcarata]
MPSLQCHMCLISCLSAPYISIVITVGVITVCVASSKDTTIGDFNNDNRTDIVVVNDGTLTVIVLLGADDEYSRVPLNYQGTSTLLILKQNSNGTVISHYYTTGDAYRLCSIAMGDFNNDERLDITRDVQCRHSTVFGSRPQFIAVDDFDNDKQLDIIVADSNKNNILVLKGKANGIYSIITIHSTASYSSSCSVTISHFDNDNKTDVVIADYGTNDILILNRNALYPSVSQITYSFSESRVTSYFAVSVLNHDSQLNLALSDIDRKMIGVLLGNGNRTFEKQQTYQVTPYTDKMPIAFGDSNNDHGLDIVIVLTNISEIGILFR